MAPSQPLPISLGGRRQSSGEVAVASMGHHGDPDRSSSGVSPGMQRLTTMEHHAAQATSSESSTSGDVEEGGESTAEEAYKVELLEPIAKENLLSLNFETVSAFVNASFKKPGPLDKAKAWFKRRGNKDAPPANAKKQILYSVTGQVSPGEVLALMGPSGSGKTSLLSIVAGRTPKSVDVQGRVLYNGKPITKLTKRRVGYVLQDDLLYETLTVYETLLYAALLRLPPSATQAQKLGRVDTVINALGLSKCKDTLIGGFFQRGISGGERKRVSVGHELLINPSMLMLDEPTSGLDSTTAMHLMQLLRKLAEGNRSIVTTIHQPSSRLYLQLDKLMLLSQGHVMYYGDAQQVSQWFNHLGFKLPYGTNVADFILDLAMGEVSQAGGRLGGAKGAPIIQQLYRTYEQYGRCNRDGYLEGAQLQGVQLLPASDASTKGGKQASLDVVVQKADEDTVHLEVVDEMSDLAEPTPKRGVWGSVAHYFGIDQNRGGARYREQLRVLLLRATKVKRFEALSSQRIIQIVVVALITGLFWFQRGTEHTVAAARDTIGLMFFIMMFPSIGALFQALFTFPSDYRMLLKERASGMYRLSAFYFARTFSDLPMDCLLPTLFVIVTYWMGGLRADAGVFFATWLSILLLMLLAQSIGLFIGAVFMNPKTAQTVTTVVMLTFMLVAGFFVRNIPIWISWLKYLSFIYWGYNLVLKIQLGHVQYYDCGAGTSGPVTSCPPVTNIQKALDLVVNPNQSVWLELVVISGQLVLARIAIYMVLRSKTAQKKG